MIIVFSDQPLINRNTPRRTAIPTPAPTAITNCPDNSWSKLYNNGALLGSTPDPAVFRTAIAGSANVAPTPSINAKIRIMGREDFTGSFVPNSSPKGISPSINPSRNNIKLTMTIKTPNAIVSEYTMGSCNTSIWNNRRYTIITQTLFNCSRKSLLTYGRRMPSTPAKLNLTLSLTELAFDINFTSRPHLLQPLYNLIAALRRPRYKKFCYA